MKNRQSGISLIGFLLLLVVLGFFAYMGMKLVPCYIEFFGAKKAMSQLAADGGSGDLNEIRRNLAFKMNFQYVDDSTIQPKDITLDRQNGATVLKLSYDKRVHFIYNIDFLLHFENAVPMRNSQA
ncbi:MAG: hypothetical protein GAK28_02980 [Luteibacter sp.]|uniref:DUF4845 domain-containing protein n=1 Tax=Luteibacter sp. TaxID=1886636 RepID=UPI001384B8B7|nr:DUF4845 domain-containing protein [Luteibacter sp.]KAF1005765.1 MAG: hypothetical protein GAK28_02980 [Luteibacter sp.]